MKRIWAAFLFAFVGLLVVAQESVAPKTAIPLVVSDAHHRPTSLSVESLVITDQKMAVTGANLLRAADLPLELGVLIDASGSQRSADLASILKAAKQFVSEVIQGPNDRAFILQFATTPQATGWLTREQLQAVNVKVSMGGGTALYDAIAMACKERMGPVNRQRPTRRILVLISDGEDNRSHIKREAAASEALRAGAVMFTIDTALVPIPFGAYGAKTMDRLAGLTGGESFHEVGGQEAGRVFVSIKEMIGDMYYLTYVPPESSKSAVHEVEVRPARREKFKLSYARKYFWEQ